MFRSYFFIFLLFAKGAVCQNSPSRIGDFIINETTISKMPLICDYCGNNQLGKISSEDEFNTVQVSDESIEEGGSGTHTLFELFPDKEGTINKYSLTVSLMDSVRVFFVPNYITEGVNIKNLLLKFYNDTLVYINASLTDSYLEIIKEKYKGKAVTTEKKETVSKCKLAAKRKFKDTKLEMYFYESDEQMAKMNMNVALDEDCNMIRNNTVTIFNKNRLVHIMKSDIAALKELKKDNELKFIEQKKADSIQKLNQLKKF